jgi:hypothetical protein
MKRRSSILVVLFVMACLADLAVGQVARLPKVQVLETGGVFHGDEVKARNGERWLGLYVTKSGSQLVESILTVRRAVDEIVDEVPGQMTGKTVSVNRSTEPVFLLKGAHGLQPRSVTTIFWVTGETHYSLAEHQSVKLRLGKLEYQLKLVGERPSDAAGVLPPKPRLLLSLGKTTQTLRKLSHDNEDGGWELIWAGDLDGDGRLDLYANLPYHYNVSQRKLFLSSHAQPGQLVREVGEFVTTGC